MLVFGLICTAFDLLTFLVLLQVFRASESIFQTAWFVVSLLTELGVLLVLRTHRPAWRSAPSRWLLWSTLATLVLALAVPYLKPFARLFGFSPLPAPLLTAMLAIVVGYVLVTKLGKRWFYGISAVPRVQAPSAPLPHP